MVLTHSYKLCPLIYNLFTLVGRRSHYCPSGWFSQVFKLFLSCCTCYHCFDPETDSTLLTAAALLSILEFLSLPFLYFIGFQAETLMQGSSWNLLCNALPFYGWKQPVFSLEFVVCQALQYSLPTLCLRHARPTCSVIAWASVPWTLSSSVFKI